LVPLLQADLNRLQPGVGLPTLAQVMMMHGFAMTFPS
jgi:hypothetical protein